MTRKLKHLVPKIPPGPACVVRKARLDEARDRAEVARLLGVYADEALGMASLDPGTAAQSVEMLSQSRDAFVLIASVGASHAGMAICLPSISTFAAAGVINVHDLWVDATFRKRGIASELLRCVQREADHRACVKVTLEVREDNTDARRLYRRRGFRGEPGTIDAPGTFFLELPL